MTSAKLKEEQVQIDLSKAEALVFFEWLSRNWEVHQWQNKDYIQNPAEKQLLIWLENDLQKILPEPFDENYKVIINHCYKEVLSNIENS